ncbi:MAG: response regulator [Bacillota bacterium]
MKSKKIRVLIADDHALMRKGIKDLLQLEEDISIVGEASDGKEALKYIETLKPDCVILDYNMPKMTGLEVTKEIINHSLETKIILLTINDDKASLLNTLNAGASGYLLKDSDPSKLVEAIKEVYNGDNYIDKHLIHYLVDIYKETKTKKNKFSSLTKREKEVLLKLSEGLKNSEIAKKLFISEKTVKNYISSIYSKLEINDRVKLALFAIKNNLDKYIE